jgi:sigma-E factor negative regulatory protein RseA
MERSEASSKEPAASSQAAQVSALVDGEVDPADLRACIAQLARGEGRQEWDCYHQIGDAIRCVEPGPSISTDFDARFAERFASEPVLLPRRSLLARLGAWPTTIAALAAAGFGFFIAPTLMPDVAPSRPASGMTAAAHIETMPTATAKAAMAAATPLVAQAHAEADDTLDYIALHHRAHASLYGAAPAVGSAVFDTASHR